MTHYLNDTMTDYDTRFPTFASCAYLKTKGGNWGVGSVIALKSREPDLSLIYELGHFATLHPPLRMQWGRA